MNALDLSSCLIVPPQYRYAHIKRDGIQVELLRNRDQNSRLAGQWKAYTRTPRDITEDVKQVPSAARAFSIGLNGIAPPFNRVHGELYWQGREAKDVKSAIADGLHAQLLFEVHWLDWSPVSPKDYAYVEADLRTMLYACMRYGLAFTPWLDLHDWTRSTILNENIADAVAAFVPGTLSTRLLLECRDANSDGWVLKDHAHNDKQWLKLKPRTTVDLEIIGYTDGKGKYAGLIGALILTGGVRVSGMDDTTRRMFSADRCRYLGHKVEVAYEKVIPGTKGLRHPRFIRLRDDLSYGAYKQ